MMGLGCKYCTVERCDTILYRGSRCMELRSVLGLGDPQTNYDRIHGMNPVELSEFLLHTKTVCDWCDKHYVCGIPDDMVTVEYCLENVRKWLEQGVSDV